MVHSGSQRDLLIVYYLLPLGEHLTEAELVEYLMTLMGCSDNPEVEGCYTEDTATALNELPLQLSAPSFAEDLLGLST